MRSVPGASARYNDKRGVVILSLLLLLLSAWGAWAQSADKLAFEAATLKLSPPPNGGFTVSCNGGPGTKDPTLFTCQNMTLSNLISQAYGVDYYQLSMPSGIGGSGVVFHVNARVAPGTTKDQFKAMLQNLLAERLHLVVHHETRELAKYELVVGKNGPRFKEAAPPKEDGAEAPAAPAGAPKRNKDGYAIFSAERPGMAIFGNNASLYYPEMTMERLASQLSAQLAAPVTDVTGLKGKYAVGLYWSTESLRASGSEDTGPTLMQAVQDQLGLRLEQRKGPVDFIVVDHAEKVPADN